MSTWKFIAIAIFAFSQSSDAKTLRLSPDTFDSLISSVESGDTVILSSSDGEYKQDVLRFYNKSNLEIVAENVRARQVWIANSKNIEWIGGTFGGKSSDDVNNLYKNVELSGFKVIDSQNISVSNIEVIWAYGAIGVSNSDHITITKTDLHDNQSDGIDFACVRDSTVSYNTLRNTHAIKPIIDPKNGTKLQDGDHPDFFQAWSTPGCIGMYNIEISHNVVSGYTQGISFFNKPEIRFRNIRIDDNEISIQTFNAISVGWCDDCAIRRNVVRTEKNTPGYVGSNGAILQIFARIYWSDSERMTACGNDVSGHAEDSARSPCR